MKKQNCVIWVQTVSLYTYDIYEDIAEDIVARFDTLDYELDKPLPKVKNKKVIVLKKYELCWKILIEFVGLTARTCSYLIDDGSKDKKKVQKSVS